MRFLGKKGALTAQLKSLGALPAEERPAAGAAINDAKQKVQGWLDVRESALRNGAIERRARERETLDVTLPGRRQSSGGLHPVSQALERIEQIFATAGYASSTVRRSKTTITTSKRSTFRRTIRRARCTTRST